ncbi:hypothetical protein EIP86_010363 [Pleurotus ostreatoroseus]|nr:hypothetical protein EIP86_010363 [Pleurotus ostreatoroseus]
MPSEVEYKLLPGYPVADADDLSGDGQSAAFAAILRRQRTFLAAVVAETTLIVILIAVLFVTLSTNSALETQSSQFHYCKEYQSAAQYVETVFTSNLRESNIYIHHPNEDVDKAWIDLYSEYGLSKIPKAEAMKMSNKTLPIPDDPEHYIIALPAHLVDIDLDVLGC